MSLELQVLEPTDLEAILLFETQKLAQEVSDENERQFQSWSARWREESLRQYLPLGWSFKAVEDGRMVGYFLAQPLLFLDGQTQSLWIEHVQFVNLAIRDVLCDMAVRLGREKHLQRVYFPSQANLQSALSAFRPEVWQPNVTAVKTTK